MRLEPSLVLNRYLHHLFGARSLEELKQPLAVEGGIGPTGQSPYYGALLGRVRDANLAERLHEYDARVLHCESRLAKARGSFSLKYFQYLSLLYTEIFLDRLTEDPEVFLRELNAFLGELKRNEGFFGAFPTFQGEDLRRLALFMATGSGKTLLMHANLWQFLHCLGRCRHPEALVDRAGGRREFDSLILITPNEGLSQQHLEEFERSGIEAVPLIQDREASLPGFAPKVKVIEIHKLADKPSKEGVSILLEELGSHNLVFVDEGHKGTGSEAQTWKSRQRALSLKGFLLEYSATFAQAIAAAGTRARESLLGDYGKTILFDYSYRHFYEDGYGKDFRVLNLERARETQAQELLVGGMLAFYQQMDLFRKRDREFRPYNLAKPLWVFLGSSVNAVYSLAGRKRSDVATVVAFLKRFLEDPEWAVGCIDKVLQGKSGFQDAKNAEDLFLPFLSDLKRRKPEKLYREILAEVFHGRGGLELWELKRADGELALRTSTHADAESPYFGIINIGDVAAFKKHLESMGIQVQEDRFTPSLFSVVNDPESRVHLLVGAKKFIEGWSSWRVSAMGLLNIGKGEGPQVIQLFGRGVRLKGKDWTLKRSGSLPEKGPHPEGLSRLETLFIFGWNADYLRSFHQMMEQEELGWVVQVPVKCLNGKAAGLPVPKPRKGADVQAETWCVQGETLWITIDLTPRTTVLSGAGKDTARVGEPRPIDFAQDHNLELLDLDRLYAETLEYKNLKGYGNVFLARDRIPHILGNSTLILSELDLSDVELLREGALRVLKAYLDRFVARSEREAEQHCLEPQPLMIRETVQDYSVRVSSREVLEELEGLRQRPHDLYSDGGKPLPRLHVDRHLFSPILLDPQEYGVPGLSVSPPGLGKGEAKLLKDLREFWSKHHRSEAYRHLEIFLLRNVPRVGVGFFRTSGFYPDFILWIRDRKSSQICIRFLEPHGMHHGGLAGNREKIEAFRDLAKLSRQAAFSRRKIRLDGYLLTETDLKDIGDARNREWSDLEKDHRVLRQEGNYIEKILRT